MLSICRRRFFSFPAAVALLACDASAMGTSPILDASVDGTSDVSEDAMPDVGDEADVGGNADSTGDAPSLEGGADTASDSAPDGPGEGGTGTACTRESDCAAGFDCTYSTPDGCPGTGSCEPKAQPIYSGSVTPLCTCGGVSIEVGDNITGFPAPIAHDGPCTPDGGPFADAGACSAWGAGCTTTSNCCSGLQCIDDVPTTLPGYCVP